VQNEPARPKYLPGQAQRAVHMRMDIARILKRFYFCERALVIAQAGWIAGVPNLEAKLALSHILWQDAMTADACRNRVFELRYPSRMLEVSDDAPIIDLFQEAINAPSGAAFLLALAEVLKPAQAAAYRQYLEVADELADGPSIRFMRIAVQEKQEQVSRLKALAGVAWDACNEVVREQARTWLEEVRQALADVGGLTLEAPTAASSRLSHGQPFRLAEVPARDLRFHQCRFYWPDAIDPDFPYGDGILLQLRSAVSHLNEVWAVETGGAILHAFADKLEWAYVMDAARWTYDEGRHMQMGFERLARWGFEPQEMPLGTYIYDSARGQPPIIRLGMLHYFETKNIGKKTERAAAFSSYQDSVSQHDMEFDWADETLHAHYGRRMLKRLRERYPDEVPEVGEISAQCDRLVKELIATATAEERKEIRQVAEAMIRKAEQVAVEGRHG
jgi:hypothetical protein